MKHDNSSQKRLDELVGHKEPGQLLFPSEYFDIGTPEAIHMAFSRLVGQNVLTRMGKGIYLKPKMDPELGSVYPSLEEIARKVAEKERVVIRPTGSYALNKLGLSTQVPTKVVFLTNGSPRTIRIGKGTITFKSTTPKRLAAKNDTVFLAIQALIELGEKGTTGKIIESLCSILEREGPSAIREDARSAPNHVAKTLYLIADKIESNGRIPPITRKPSSSDHRTGERPDGHEPKSS
jgi:Family of unknown function (DUF6088)